MKNANWRIGTDMAWVLDHNKNRLNSGKTRFELRSNKKNNITHQSNI